MAYQALGLGSTANDGTGDSLRTGGDKINDNFVEIYTKLGDGSTLTADTVTLLTATQTLTNKTLTSPTITGTGAIAGTFTGNITGAVTGNVTGDITGNVTGDLTGAVTGNVTGDITGNVTGNLTGNVSTTSGNIELDATTHIVEVMGGGSDSGAIILNCEANSHGQTLKSQPHSVAATNTMLLPQGADSTLVSLVSADTLTNKSIDLTDNTITGTTAEFNTALSDGSFATLAGTETLTNKTLTSATLTGLFGSVQSLSGAGAVDVTNTVTEITSTAADALTLADGTVGQIKVITMIVDGGDATLTPTTFAGGSTITFNDAGDSVILVYNTTVGWVAVANQGATIA